MRYMIHQAESAQYNIPLLNTMQGVWYDKYALPRLNYVHGFTAGVPLKDKHMNIGHNNPRQKGWILLVRSPERVMISYFHDCAYRQRVYNEDNISNFIRDPIFGIKNYIDYVEFYYNEIQPFNHIIVTYEDLRRNTFENLKNILEFSKLSLPDDTIKTIINNSTLEKMKAAEKSNKYKVGWLCNPQKDSRAAKARSGGKEKLENLFTPEDLSYLRACYEKSIPFIRLGYV